MKKGIFAIMVLLSLSTTSCIEKAQTMEKAENPIAQTHDVARYKLFSTQNMWTFIKLDTKTGKMWQVQYSLDGDEGRAECDLNAMPLVTNDTIQANGRFELYPTSNFYNFILLDQIEGKTWQVQWSFEEENRAVLPISK